MSVNLQYVVLESDSTYSYVMQGVKKLTSDIIVQALADTAKDNFCRRRGVRIDTPNSESVAIYQLAKPIVLPETETDRRKLFSQYNEEYLSDHGKLLDMSLDLPKSSISDSKELSFVAVIFIRRVTYIVLDSLYSYVVHGVKELSSCTTVQEVVDIAKDDFRHRRGVRIDTPNSESVVEVTAIYQLAKPIVLPETETKRRKLFSQYNEEYLSDHGDLLDMRLNLPKPSISDSKELSFVAVIFIRRVTYIVLDSLYSYVVHGVKELSSGTTVQEVVDIAKDDFCRHRRQRIDASDPESVIDVAIFQLAKPIVLPETDVERCKLFSQYNEENLSAHGGSLAMGFNLWHLSTSVSKELFLVAVVSISSEHVRSLRPVQEEYTHSFHQRDLAREAVLASARGRKPPSAGAANSALMATQVSNRLDAMYNYRPLSLTPPPIFIYHPVFLKFVKLMETPTQTMIFSHQELDSAYDFIKVSLDFYSNETARQHKLEDLNIISSTFWRIQQLKTNDNHYIRPDGMTEAKCFKLHGQPSAFPNLNELKNGNGEGDSDAIDQAECTYIAICASDRYKSIRKVSPCPTFLLGLGGSNLAVSGAVFANNFISQRLTHYIFLGPVANSAVSQSPLDHAIREVAKVIRSLKTCLDDLVVYYQNLKEPSSSQITNKSRPPSQRTYRPNSNSRSKQPPLPQIFPFWNSFCVGGVPYILTYTGRLASDQPAKAVFKAWMRRDESEGKGGGKGEEFGRRSVVVKFTHSYGRGGHELLARRSPALAPRLWYCERVEAVGMYAAVMDYVEGHDIFNDSLTPAAAEALKTAVQMLHNEGFAFGDLRGPNVIQVKNDGIMLVDFDWCGKEGEARYPSDINLGPDIDWHKEVCRGGLIKKAHDRYMLQNLTGGDDL